MRFLVGTAVLRPRPLLSPLLPPGYSNLIIDLICPSERRKKFQRLLSGELRFLFSDEVATLLELASLYVLGDRLPRRYNVAHESFASPGEHRHFQFFCAAAEVVTVFLQPSTIVLKPGTDRPWSGIYAHVFGDILCTEHIWTVAVRGRSVEMAQVGFDVGADQLFS